LIRNILHKLLPASVLFRLSAIWWRDVAVSAGPAVVATLIALWAALYFVRPAPPDTITLTGGPEGSTFASRAEQYRQILARNGVKLKVLPSSGSLQNLQRLNDPQFRVDVGFVQGGVAGGKSFDNLASLGSLFYEPLAIYYRSTRPLTRLSELSGKKLAIGAEGSGTRALSIALLKANGIEAGAATTFSDLQGEDAAQALIDERIDAAFLMGDSATPPVMRKLLLTPGVRLADFTQADAYVRRFPYLSKFTLPMGVFDLATNTPMESMTMIGPTVELIARDTLHPALSDMLIEAAREVHGGASLFRRAGEFPAPLEHEFRISDDATRYYKSGKGFLYRSLPFWLASLADRMLVLIVPVIVLLIPGLRMVPWLYTWRIRSRLFRRYGELMALERSAMDATRPQERQQLIQRLDDVERAVNNTKMPLAFADQVYVLREHIRFVRDKLAQGSVAA
jgi:TRAP-type uncharacterized transport system substrate-binding protein